MASIIGTIIEKNNEYSTPNDVPPEVWLNVYLNEDLWNELKSLGSIRTIDHEDDYVYLNTFYNSFNSDQRAKIFDGEYEGIDSAPQIGANLLTGFFGIAGGIINTIQTSYSLWNGQGGMIRHIQDIINEEKYGELTDVKVATILKFMAPWWNSVRDQAGVDLSSWYQIGFNDPSNKKNSLIKVLLEISKRFPERFTNNLKTLEQFSYLSFTNDITTAINNWLDTDPQINGLNHAKTLGFYADDGIMYGFPDSDQTINENKANNQITVFIQDSADYLNPFPDSTNLNDVRLTGPIDTVKILGGADEGLLNSISTWTQQFVGTSYTSPAERLYIPFLQRVLDDVATLSDENLENDEYQIRGRGDTWETLYNQQVSESVNENGTGDGLIGHSLARAILNGIRLKTWNNFAEELDKISGPVDDEQAAELLSDAYDNAESQFAADNSSLLGTPAEEPLTGAQIKERQKFKKQCALMTQMPLLKEINRQIIQRGQSIDASIHFGSPYDNRFHMLTAQNKSTIPNKLIVPKAENIKPFLQITPDIHAFLVPKIRLFKVFSKEDGELDEVEFSFSNFVSPSRINTLENTFDKGDGAGVKNFSFTFEGTNPATARNDISAELTLYFQSFNDFIKKRKFKGSQDKHAYVDLLLLPAGKEKSGYGSGNPLQEDPSYYRIRADVGWMIDPKSHKQFNMVLAQRGTSYAKFKKALQVINKSFYLNMVDHDLQIRDDGTVEIKASYRAYIETALKGTAMDALVTPEIKKERHRLNKEYQKVINSNRCTIEQLNEIKAIIAQRVENLRKESYQSIMSRMVANSLIFNVNANRNDMTAYGRDGFFRKKVRFERRNNDQVEDRVDVTASNVGPNEQPTYNLDVSFRDAPTNPDDNWTTINFFYLGDLLYTILDCNYTNEQGEEGIQIPNLKFLMSSFEYDDLFSTDGDMQEANIADIPISCEYFFEWYTENVVKKEFPAYPVMFFVRDLAKHLIVNILSDNCFKVAMNKSLSFSTGNFISTQGDVFERSVLSGPNFDYNVDNLYSSGILPMENVDDTGEVSIRNFYNYIFVYAIMPPLTHQGKGNKSQDGDLGIYHYQLGSINGIMKKVNFSKTDIQYLREARFFRNGNDGLMQLGNVYRVSMEMIGNTIYYPGMEFYIDPKGIGSGDDFDPTIGPSDGREASIANALGLGGYHLVTRVKSDIAPGKFTTSVEGQFIYSGDGNPRKLIDGERESSINKVETKIEQRSQNCETFVNAFYREVLSDGTYKVDVEGLLNLESEGTSG